MLKANDSTDTTTSETRNECALRKAAMAALLALLFTVSLPSSAQAAPGNCSAPTAENALINATECLFILKAAVGIESCPVPVCTCDPSGNGLISANDALICLRKALGFPITLECPAPCDGKSAPCDTIELIVQSGSDLDSGWKGPGHDADIIEGASVSFAILSRCSDDQSVCQINADCSTGPCEATCDCGGTGDTECEVKGPTGESACLGDTSIPCTADFECTGAGGLCVPFFGPPLPLAASGTPVCVTTYFAEDFSGTIDVATGDVAARAALRSRVHLGLNIQSPCPSCGGRGAAVGASSRCAGGPHDGAPCTVEAVSPQFGGVSSDCPPDRTANVSGQGLNILFREFTTAKVTASAVIQCGFPFNGLHPSTGNGACLDDFSPCNSNADCTGTTCGLYCHCGFCDSGDGPDPDLPCMDDSQCDEGSLCSADPQKQLASQAQPNGCASLVCGDVNTEQCCTADDGPACADPTGLDGECNVYPSPCSTDHECVLGGNGDACVRTPRACFENTITRTGSPQPFGSYCTEDSEVAACTSDSDCGVGPCVSGTSEPVTVSLFCIPGTASSGINAAAGLPGPAAVELNSVVRIVGFGDENPTP